MSTFSRRQAVGAAALSALAVALPTVAEAAPADSMAQLKKVIDAHNKAFTAQDLKGVLATMSPKAILMGTAPGEMWVGQSEIEDAYRHYFLDFDAGRQSFENLFHDGRIVGDMAWIVAVTKVTLHKGDKTRTAGLNLSLAFEKIGGQWKICSFHYSNVAKA